MSRLSIRWNGKRENIVRLKLPRRYPPIPNELGSGAVVIVFHAHSAHACHLAMHTKHRIRFNHHGIHTPRLAFDIS